MSSNKGVKEEMIKRYGAKCFIERLHLRDTKGQKYKGKGQYKRMKQLTFHHIRMKSKGRESYSRKWCFVKCRKPRMVSSTK